MKEVQIGNKIAKIPIIQGGMGIGVSLSNLAGHVALEGGIGIISTAQAGYDDPIFSEDHITANCNAIKRHIKQAKEISQGNGLVGVNIMVASSDYKYDVAAAIEAGADVIISGAGLPTELAGLVKDSDVKFAPIVSSARAAKVLLKLWDTKHHTTCDFIVIEGPEAGGHLGFSYKELENIDSINMDDILLSVIEVKKDYEEKYGHPIPVFIGGGVFTSEDIKHYMNLGADGVQIGSRFVATYECDASDAYKNAYINATSDDIEIVKSPVGMPGRAIKNDFLERLKIADEPVKRCFNCIKSCSPAKVPYCITDALIITVKGDADNGLIFCGSNVDRINKIVSVHELMQELTKGL